MASGKTKDPLDALQVLINDVLVQTGKALRASRKDSQGNPISGPVSLQSKLPDTISAFHVALDDLESDIIRAKSVLLRDLDQLQAQKKAITPPEPPPVEPQSKSPLAIDLGSSSPVIIKDEPMMDAPAAKPMAPFPDMGIELPDPPQPVHPVKEENDSSLNAHSSNAQVGPSAPVAVMPSPEKKPAEMKLDAPISDVVARMPDAGMHFTDMEFTLAPPANSESQNQPATMNEPSFDLATFAPADGGDGMLTLDSLLPTSKPEPSTTASAPVAEGSAGNPQAKKEEAVDNTFDDILYNDSAADGMDFDFSIGGDGTGDDTFDDLMNNRDGDFELMQPGEFDTAYFGIDKQE